MISYLLSQYLHSRPKAGKDPSFRVAPAIELLRKHLPAGRQILDIGCRNAIEPTLLRAAGWQVEAVDLWPMAPGIRRGRMEALPYPNVSCDLAFLSHSFEHGQNLHEAAREISRVVRPGGLVWIEVPFRAEPNAHDRHRFDSAGDVLHPFALTGSRPYLLHADQRGAALRVLFGLERPLRVALALTGRLHERNWLATGLVERMWNGGWDVGLLREFRPGWRHWLRRGPLRTASYVTRARRWATYRHKLDLREHRALRYRLANRGWRLLGRFVDLERLAQRVERWLPADRRIRRALSRRRPDVLVIPTTIHEGLEVDLAKEAKRLRIPVVAHIAGFDTLTSKGAFLGWRPDRLLVWGEDAKRWAMEAHGFSAEQVVVTGPPQYDLYFQGSDPPPPFPFVYVPGSTLSWWGDMGDTLNVLAKSLPPDVRLCYTPHPQQALDVGALGLGERLWCPPWPKGWQWESADFRRLGGLLRHARCVVSPWSTLVVEAAIFGTPSVLVGFGRGVAAYGDYEHLAAVRKWPGIFLARSLDGLAWIVNKLVTAPTGGWEDLATAAQQVALADGHAGARIMDAVEDLVLRRPDA